jgi:hypothetical protein
MILRAIEPIKALQNPQRKRNPGTNQAANPKIMAFNTKRNNPKVKIMKGNVKKPNIGPKRAFKIPKTAAEIAALPKLSISTPIGKREIIKKLTVVTSHVMRSPVIRKLLLSNRFGSSISSIRNKCDEKVIAMPSITEKGETLTFLWLVDVPRDSASSLASCEFVGSS